MTAAERILTIAHGHPALSHGGSERAAYTLHQAYQRSPRVDAAWFLAVGPDLTGSGRLGQWQPGEYLLDNAAVDALRMRTQRDELSVAALLDLVAQLQATTVHLHHYYLVGTDTIHALRQAFPGLKIVLTLHEYLAICHHDGQLVKVGTLELCDGASPPACARCFPQVGQANMWLRRDYMQRTLLLADVIVAPSRHLADTYVRWGLPAARVHVIENAQAVLQPLPPRPRDPGDRTVRLAYFGQVTPYKGLDVLFGGLSLVPRRVRRQLSLVVNGANLAAQREDVKARLTTLSETLAAEGTVRWAGSYRHDALSARLASIDWVVVPSIWWENSPMVIQEALASARPVMCSDIGGMAEKVQHDVNGWHVRAGDAQAWADAFEAAADGRIDWPRLSAAAHAGPSQEEVAAAHLALLGECGRPLSAVKTTPQDP